MSNEHPEHPEHWTSLRPPQLATAVERQRLWLDFFSPPLPRLSQDALRAAAPHFAGLAAVVRVKAPGDRDGGEQ